MRNRKSAAVVFVLSLCCLAPTGCIDAARDGVTTGITRGIRDVIADVVQTALEGFIAPN